MISFVSKFFFNFKKLIKLGPSDSILLITKQWGHNEPYKKLVQIQKIRVVVQKTIDSGDNKEYTRSKAFLKEKTPSCPPKRLQWCPFKSFCLLLFWISNYLHMYLCRSMRTSYQRCPMVLLIWRTQVPFSHSSPFCFGPRLASLVALGVNLLEDLEQLNWKFNLEKSVCTYCSWRFWQIWRGGIRGYMK